MPALPPVSASTSKPLALLAELLKLQLEAGGVYVDLGSQGVISAKQSEPYNPRDWLNLLAGARIGLLRPVRTLVITLEQVKAQKAYLIVQSPGNVHFSRETMAQVNSYATIASALLQQNHQLHMQQQRIAELKTSLQIADAGLFRVLVTEESFIADEMVASLLGINDAHIPISFDAALVNIRAEGRKVMLEKTERVLKFGGKERVVFQMQDGSWCSAIFMRDTQVESGVEIKGLLRTYTISRQSELESEQHQAQLETLIKQLRATNRTDPLTGLANRIELNERMSVITRENSSAATWISMLVLDIDHFKSYNDSFGHAAGDAALQQVAAIIKRSINQADLAARFGGEEFCVLTPAPLSEALALAEKIRAAIEYAKWPARGVTVSIGACSMAAAQFESDTLFKSADNALYHAKRSGRNCVRASTKSALV